MSIKNLYIMGTMICAIVGIISMTFSKPLFILCLICMFIFIILTNIESSKNIKNKYNKDIEHIDNELNQLFMNKDDIFYHSRLENGLVIDKRNSILGIISKTNNRFVIKQIPFSSIIESEIIEDGRSVIKTSIGSQIGRGIIGGAIAGGVGAVIASQGATRKSETEIKNISLLITVDDLDNPFYKIIFMNLEDAIESNDKIYIKFKEEALKWYKTLDVIIHRQDKQMNNN